MSTREANRLCKSLSEIVARCSYAIYLAHSSPVWMHNQDLVKSSKTVVETEIDKTSGVDTSEKKQVKSHSRVNSMTMLRQKGVKALYHFTDAANMSSILKHGLMSAADVFDNSLVSTMNSDALSRSV